jgi:hypothetical protein
VAAACEKRRGEFRKKVLKNVTRRGRVEFWKWLQRRRWPIGRADHPSLTTSLKRRGRCLNAYLQ